jgi:hypothetical protein
VDRRGDGRPVEPGDDELEDDDLRERVLQHDAVGIEVGVARAADQRARVATPEMGGEQLLGARQRTTELPAPVLDPGVEALVQGGGWFS